MIDDIKICLKLISDWQEYRLQKQVETMRNCEVIINDFNIVSKEVKELNKKKSCDLNYFRVLGISETTHSYLLSLLLNPIGEHGQGSLFLNSFLKLLGIKEPEEGLWIVTAEVGRVDVLLKREHPKSVVVIENKSNWAIDQPNQLYRYWKNEIDSEVKAENLNYDTDLSDTFQLVYLTPNKFKRYSADSIACPPENPGEYPIIPIKITEWCYNKEIIEWLNISLNKIDPENHRLREFILQYQEIWK